MELGKVTKKYMPEDPTIEEAYKLLRTNLLYTPDLKIITVTSTTANEGKTTTSFYLAKSFAEIGKKVVIVDCDLRKGTLRKFFNIQEAVGGLSEYLSKQSDNFIYETDIDNLYVVFSGQYPPNPTEILTSTYFERLMKMLRKVFDIVIVDTTPIGVGADGALAARLSDGVVMVVRNNYISKKRVKKSKIALERHGTKVIGVVFNRIKKHQSDYNEYYYYG